MIVILIGALIGYVIYNTYVMNSQTKNWRRYDTEPQNGFERSHKIQQIK